MPAFGEDDYEVLMREQSRFQPVRGKLDDVTNDWRPELIEAVGSDGKFTDEGPDIFRGAGLKIATKTSFAI